MSQAVNSTIDERIVEMKFDNKQFESGVKQTMSTLDKLKKKLVFKNDVKGLDNIQNSINRIDLSVAMRGIDAFQQKLSALQIFGKRIVENLADDFYGAIKKVENGIRGVFQQISTGGAKRALNIEQAKFQLEGLHIAWEDIKGDIDYAVSGTAYGLDAAAKVAAQLSASQIQVGDDMKNALRGISGVAAMTNSTYEDIGRVFTQVAGAGRLYTQDMLQLSSRGLNVAAALATQLGKTEGEIREMVTKGQIDFKTFSTAMNEAFGEQATKANDTYTGSLSNVKAALSRIGADIKAGHFETFRQVFVDLIPKLNEFKKAFKPVENVIIEVEAAIGKLLQKIISMVDVTKLVSRIAKPVEKVGKRILEVVDVVTAALEQVDAPLKAMKEFSYVSREAAMQMSGFGDAVKSTAKEEKEALNLTEDMQKAYQAAQDIWNSGKYGNGQARVDALRAAGIDPDKTQQIIEEFIKNGGNWEEAIKKVSETTSEAVDENSEKAEKLTKKVQTLATIFRNIKRTFKAVATSVTNIISALFKSVTGSLERFGLGDILIKITGKIADIAEKFTITEEAAEKLTKPVKVLLGIIKGAFTLAGKIVKVIFNIGSGILNLIYTIGSLITGNKNFQQFANKLEDGIMRIARAFGNLVKNAKQSAGLQKFLETMKLIGGTIFGVIGNVILKIVDGLEWAIAKLEKFLELIANIFMGLFKGFGFVGSTVDNFVIKPLVNIFKSTDFFASLKDTFGVLADAKSQKEVGTIIFTKIFGFIKGVLDWVVEQFNKHTLDEYLVAIKELISITALLATMSLIKNIQKLAKNGISLLGSIDKVLKSTAKVNKSIANLNNAKAFAQIAKVIVAFAGSVALIMYVVLKTADYISSSDAAAQAFENAVDAVKDMMGKVFLYILGIIAALKSIDLAISMFTSKTKLHVPILLQFGVFMFSIGYAIKQVVKAMTDLYDMKDEVFKQGGKRLLIIAGGLLGFFSLLTLITSTINKFFGGGGGEQATKGLYAMSVVLIAMSASIDILMAAVSWMSMMLMGYGVETVGKAVGYIKSIIWTLMVSLSVLIGAMAFLEHFGSSQNLAKTFVSLAILFGSIAASLMGIMNVINDLTLSLKIFPSETTGAIIAVIVTITVILGELIALVSSAAKVGESGSSALWALTVLFGLLDVLIIAIGYIASKIDSDLKLQAIGAMLIGLNGLVLAASALVRNMGSNKLKWQNILAVGGLFVALDGILFSLSAIADIPYERIGMALTTLSFVVFTMQYVVRSATRLNDGAWKNVLALTGVFVSLGAIIYALKFLTEQPVENIVAAMAGLAAVVWAMSTVVEAAGGLKNKAYKNIAALFVAFAGLGSMLVPLTLLKGEDWPGYLAAMGGLAGVVLAFGAVMKLMDASLSAGQIVATGGSIAIMAVAMAVLAAVMGRLSTIVDTDKLIKIAIVVGALAAVFTLLGIALSKAPVAIVAVIGVAGAILLIGGAIVSVTWAISALMEMFPDLMKNLQEFAYTLGTLPGFIVKGFIDGLVEAFPKVGKVIRKLIGDNVIGAAEDELDINSPSKVFEQIGNFVGQGFEGGIKESFSNMDLSAITDVKDKIAGALPEGFDLGEGLGGNILDGLQDKLNFGDVDFDMENFKMDGLGEAVKENAVESIQGIDPSTLHYTIEDLIDNPQLYDTLKAAFGETGVVAAYDAMKEHEDFLAKNPTFDAYIQNLKDYYPEEMANAYNEILNSGTYEDKEGLEQYLRKVYLDKSKLDAVVNEYSREFQESMAKFVTNTDIKEALKFAGDGDDGIAAVVRGKRKLAGKDFIGPQMIVKVKAEDEDGNVLPFLSDSTSDLNLDFSNSSVKTNMDAVSGDISDAINNQTTKLTERLNAVEGKIGTFDNNQLSRTNNLISRISQLESAISNIQLRLDTGALVGQMIGPIDNALGEQARRKARG